MFDHHKRKDCAGYLRWLPCSADVSLNHSLLEGAATECKLLGRSEAQVLRKPGTNSSCIKETVCRLPSALSRPLFVLGQWAQHGHIWKHPLLSPARRSASAFRTTRALSLVLRSSGPQIPKSIPTLDVELHPASLPWSPSLNFSFASPLPSSPNPIGYFRVIFFSTFTTLS